MVRLVIKLTIVALIAHACLKITPVFWSYLQFKDALAESARFAGKKTVDQLKVRAEQIATEHEVPLSKDEFEIMRGPAFTTIDTSYTAQLEYLPRQYYPWEFKIHVEEAPPRYGDFAP
jgi:hypothetical protein